VKARFFVGAAFLLLAVACRPGRPALGPLPERIESLQGFASIRYSRGGSSARARLAFRLVAPDRAGLEALDPLNRTLFTVGVEGEDATLIVPSRKAYWTGARADVLDAGLGFPLSVAEMIGLLSGRWPEGPDGQARPAGWTLTRDGEGRIAAGRRDGFDFRVDEFFTRTAVPRKLVFRAANSSGTLTVLGLTANEAGSDAMRPPAVPPSFARLTRSEMERLLRHED
jgi:hypothetical protein